MKPRSNRRASASGDGPKVMNSSISKGLGLGLVTDLRSSPPAMGVGMSGHGVSGSKPMECRVGCGACCIAPSISSPIPGMPDGKPAGVRCVQLSVENLCLLFGKAERPAVCSSLPAMLDTCGATRAEAMELLSAMEVETAPERSFSISRASASADKPKGSSRAHT